MTLPTDPRREDPIFKPAEKPCSDPGHGAAFILVHGLGDTAEGLEGKESKQTVHSPPLTTPLLQMSQTNSKRITSSLI